MLSFFPRDVLDEILNLIESVSEDFLTTLAVKSATKHCIFKVRKERNSDKYREI